MPTTAKCTRSILVALVCVAGTASTHVRADAPPSAPGGVRTALYPGAGGELFWERASDDVGVVGYEVTRDGLALGTIDALSLYAPALSASGTYRFTVTAIDTTGQRSATVATSVGGGGVGDGPAAPAGLRAEVYSGTAAELFWERAPGTAYRVTRDGVEIGRTDGTSFFDDGLAPGTGYRYAVAAVRDGAEGEAAEVALTTRGGASSGPTPPASGAGTGGDPGDGPEEVDALRPTDLALSVYSDTAAELTWTSAWSQGRALVLSNEVRRDGELVATLPGYGARSWFDADREPGRSYVYEVTAIRGPRSATARFDGAGDGGGRDPLPAPGGAELPAGLADALGGQFDAMNVEGAERAFAAALRLATFEGAGLVAQPGTVVDAGGSDTVFDPYACPGGGRLLNSTSLTPGRLFLRVEGCRVGPITLDGLVNIEPGVDVGGRLLPGNSPGNLPSVTLREALLIDARDGTRVRIESARYEEDAAVPDDRTLVSSGRIDVDGPRGTRSVDSPVFQGRDTFAGTLPDGTVGATLRLRGADGDLLGSVDTRGPLEYASEGDRDAGRPFAGRLSIGGVEGEARYEIDAFDGNLATFTFTVFEGDAVTSYTLPWGGRYRLREPRPETVDLGF